MKHTYYKCVRKALIFLLSCILFIQYTGCVLVYADDGNNSSKSIVSYYSFNDNKYSFEDANIENDRSALGNFSINGDYTESMGNNVPVFFVNSGKLQFVYKWSVEPKEVENEWYVGNDGARKIDAYDLGGKMEKGSIIVQSSKDMINWSTNESITNFVEEYSSTKQYNYETNEIQINSGCYYRIIVSYMMEKYTNESFLYFFTKKNIENKRYADVYTFYVMNENTPDSNSINATKYKLSDSAKWCKQFSGYADTKEINVDDIHYQWNLGSFLVNGHTDVVMDNENNPVVLKNLGDQVVLWFRLEQNIDSLNNDDSLRITQDKSGKDQYFGTDTMDFGKGTLIISKKDYQREQKEIEIYTNYLEAYVVPGADTMISLFEEGDYEVSLDYEVTKDTLKVFDKKVLDKTRHYKIDFKFKVRNSNCMVYPLDVTTGEKLINGSYSKDGFYLDLAKSRYLQINVKKSDLKDGTSELVEDVSFNQLAKDGDKFTDEGLYTVTVTNRYTNISDEKKIYVGKNDILKAYAVTGMSISEIKEKLEGGAVINEDGTIGLESFDENARVFAGLDDEDLITYVEDSVYSNLIAEFNDTDLLIENVEAKFVSRDYLENLTYNSKNNLYFGYDAKELDSIFDGKKYVFTLGDDYQTVVKPIEIIDDSISSDILKNVVVGSGVILICATVSVVSAPAAPAISVIFAASAASGTSFALQSGAISGITAGIIRGYQTGDPKEAIKSAAVSASEGYKWGAIVGAITGGAKETFNLYKATENGLTMNEVAKIQKDSGYPMELIKQFKTYKEYEIYKNAGLKAIRVGDRIALVPDIDLNLKVTMPDGSTLTNLQLMEKGYAPRYIDVDGSLKAYQVHHVNQEIGGSYAVLTEAQHQGNAAILNKPGKTGVHNSELGLSDSEWAKLRQAFWKSYYTFLRG